MPQPQLIRAAAVGVAAGLAGAYLMELWQTGATRLKAAAAESQGETPDEGEAATEKVADAASRLVRGRKVSDEGRAEAGRRTHYLTGAAIGAAYGVTTELWPPAGAALGGGLAVASALALDETLVPALGFGPPPTETALVDHAYSFMAHLIFGVGTESARRLLRGR